MHSNATWQVWYLWKSWDFEKNFWSSSAGLKYAWVGCMIIDSSGSWRSMGMKRLSHTGSLSCILATKEQMPLASRCVWTLFTLLRWTYCQSWPCIYCMWAFLSSCSSQFMSLYHSSESLRSNPVKELSLWSQVVTPVKELDPEHKPTPLVIWILKMRQNIFYWNISILSHRNH